MNQYEVAKRVGLCVDKKIRLLQRGYCGAGGQSSSASRAALAQLRHLSGAEGNSWIINGPVVFDRDLLDEIDPCDREKAIKAVRAALELYAWHQQSQSNGKAMLRERDETREELKRRRFCSFGSACRRIQPKIEEAEGVRRRLESAEAAANFEGVVHYVRALIRLMKSCPDADKIQLDYCGLAQDLYLVQLPGKFHDRVFMEWGTDYYTFFDQNSRGTNEEKDEARKARH